MATILVVDDYPIIHRLLRFTLQKQGHTVVTALNGREALARLDEGSIDLVITDMAMPEMDGMALLRHLRADERYKDLPVIMLTASGQDEDRAEARTAGASDFLTKPTSSGELVAIVSRLVGG